MGGRVLVTGVAGFLGSFLAERLIKEGYEVIGVDNFFRGKLENIGHLDELNLIEADIRKLPDSIFKDVSIVFHFAAINGTKHFYERPMEVLSVNVEGTIEVLKHCKNIDLFVFASSSEVYGEPIIIPTPETHPILLQSVDNPRYSYSASKVIGEYYVKWFAETRGFDYIIERIFNVYGPRMDTTQYGQVIPEFIRKVLKEDKFTIISPGTQIRSFNYVDDFVEMTMQLVKKVRNEIVNVGNPEPIDMISLARLIHDIAGREFDYSFLPAREGDVMRRIPDINKFIKLTGFKPKTKLKEGLRKTFEWYKEKIGGRHGKDIGNWRSGVHR